MVIPIGHHAPPGTDAVRGGENNGDNRHRNVFYRLRHGDHRKHKILKWDDIKFTPVDAKKDGGEAGMGGGQGWPGRTRPKRTQDHKGKILSRVQI